MIQRIFRKGEGRKRIIAMLIIYLVFAIPSFAQNVSISKAANSFLLSSFNKELRGSSLMGSIIPIKNSTHDTLAYVVALKPQGYIILSSSTTLSPIIAFSTESNFIFQASNDNVLLDMIVQDITQRLSYTKAAIAQGDSSLIKANNKKWKKLLEQSSISKNYDIQYGPLLSSVWGGVNCVDFYSQPIFVGNYYTPNNYSPGCVATSTSIVMHYYKWPLQGVGYHTDYDNSGASQGAYYANFGGTKYKWGRMLDKYYLQNSYDKHQAAMGELAYHCAIAFDMDFEFDGSTSNLNRTPLALDNYFRFSSHYENSSWYSFWTRMRQNIRDSQPVTIAISKSNGEGHIMVCDGYGQDAGQAKYYHLQFGWWGSYNGWYDIQGNWDANGYTLIDGAVFDILPDPIIGEAIRTADEFEFIIPILVSDSLHWDSFKIWESYNGGNWVLLDAAFVGENYPRKVTESGNYRYKAQAKVNGNYYSNSISEVGEVNVARKDSALVTLDFDGDDSFFIKDNYFNDLDISDNYTIETWVKINSLNTASNYDVILDRRTVFSLYLIPDYNADYAIRFVSRNGSDAITASLRSDSCDINLNFSDWVHIAISRFHDTTLLFINGQEIDSSLDTNFSLRYSIKALNIGARYWGSYGRYMLGELDEIRISDTARYFPNQSFSPYRCMPFETDTNTVLLLHLDENSGDAIGDFSMHFFNTNLRSSPNYPNWKKVNQTASVVYSADFSAIVIDEAVELKWSTSFEDNNDGFEILKSTDANNWNIIGKVDGKYSSNTNIDYSFIDENPPLGRNYYRLRQIEPQCRYTFTAIDSVMIVPSGEIDIYPNPVSDVLIINGMEGLKIGTIKLFDLLGKEHLLYWIDESQLDVSKLSYGMYFIIIEVEGEFVKKKFIVE